MGKFILLSALMCLIGAIIFLPQIRSSSIDTNPANNEGITPLLKFVASADGKSFFADRSSGKTWSAASTYCKSYGMKLASITSLSQWSALVSAYNSADFFDGYWTSGRDSQDLRQFNWNDTNTEAYAGYLTYKEEISFSYLTCLAFLSAPDNESHLYHRQCSTAIGALCET